MPGLRSKNPRYMEELKNRFMESFEENENGCWIWQKSLHKQGYGNCSYKGKNRLAHRISWIIFKGEISNDLCVLHKCDVTTCVNPNHLFLGTYQDNALDCWNKKRKDYSGRKHPRSKITIKDSEKIKKLLQTGISQREIGLLFKVKQTTISKIKLNTHWTTKFSKENIETNIKKVFT